MTSVGSASMKGQSNFSPCTTPPVNGSLMGSKIQGFFDCVELLYSEELEKSSPPASWKEQMTRKIPLEGGIFPLESFSFLKSVVNISP